MTASSLRGSPTTGVALDVEGAPELHAAGELWGLGTYATQTESPRDLVTPRWVVCIGAAGERLVRMAALINDDGNPPAARAWAQSWGPKV